MILAVTRWLQGLWAFYLAYTKTGVHAATAAAFAIFGLLVFVDPLFAALAIGSYVVPPVIMYALAEDPIDEYVHDERSADADERPAEAMVARDGSRLAEKTTANGGAGKTDRSAAADESRSADERADRDTDSDRDDGDTDSDSDDGDTDSDSDDGDTDSDSDDGDTDSDSDDGDTDSDSDDGDTDSDSDS